MEVYSMSLLYAGPPEPDYEPRLEPEVDLVDAIRLTRLVWLVAAAGLLWAIVY